MIEHLQGNWLKNANTSHYRLCGGGVNISLTYLFITSNAEFIIHSPSNKEDAHTLFGFMENQKGDFQNVVVSFGYWSKHS
jgi:Holliday junction resolvasome RuvABC DNA-binding subunit